MWLHSMLRIFQSSRISFDVNGENVVALDMFRIFPSNPFSF